MEVRPVDDSTSDWQSKAFATVVVGGLFAYAIWDARRKASYTAPSISGRVKPIEIPKVEIPRIELPKEAPVAPLAELVAGCTPNPVDVIEKVNKQIASGKPSNVLYKISTPDGELRFRIIVKHKGEMKIGFIQTPAGVAVLHDGPMNDVRRAFMAEVRKAATNHDLQVRIDMGGAGNNLIDELAKFKP